MRYQLAALALITIDDCVSCGIFPARASRQFRQAQFHCGNPPPAAAPRIRIRVNELSDRARVTGAFEKDQHLFKRRFDPFFSRNAHLH